ncbi:hypothetical protein QQ045_002316 [Rhodiola kirilowii]
MARTEEKKSRCGKDEPSLDQLVISLFPCRFVLFYSCIFLPFAECKFVMQVKTVFLFCLGLLISHARFGCFFALTFVVSFLSKSQFILDQLSSAYFYVFCTFFANLHLQ